MQSAKASQLPLFTVNEDPKDAVVASHRLLVRAGFIKKQASGFYTFLPFGLSVLQKVEQIIREEMNRSGGVEVKLPVLTSGELWQQSGRYNSMGKEMMRLNDRHENGFVLGPTHEEAMSSLAASYLRSYKQLPLNLYQIGTKYRDEIRPRYGLIRCREFLMKDAYSFHLNDESLDETYQKMSQTYHAIFQRCGLETISVQADTGAMGGSGSEEFMVASEIGEETLLICRDGQTDYRANQEKAEFIAASPYPENQSDSAAEKKSTPNTKTIEEVAAFLSAEPKQFIKTVIYENLDAVVVAFLPGDREINELKLAAVSGQSDLEMASRETIVAITGAEPGFAGPFGLPVKDGDEIKAGDVNKKVSIYYDRNLTSRGSLISGGNETDTHYVNLQEGRDFTIVADARDIDLVLAQENDAVPGAPEKRLTATKGIEVGHIFKLGKKYSSAFEITVLDENGKTLTPTMGTYGIGAGRTVATAVEQNHDERGIIWPENLAPFQYHLIGIFKNAEQKEKIDELYEKLVDGGLSVYYDDRKESPGVKFTDADIVGFPRQIIAGKNFIQEGKLELKNRRSGEKSETTLDALLG